MAQVVALDDEKIDLFKKHILNNDDFSLSCSTSDALDWSDLIKTYISDE